MAAFRQNTIIWKAAIIIIARIAWTSVYWKANISVKLEQAWEIYQLK